MTDLEELKRLVAEREQMLSDPLFDHWGEDGPMGIEATLFNALPDLIARVERAEKERDRLRRALRPFAAFADRFGDHARDDSWVLTRNPSGTGNLTMGDVREARFALTGDTSND